MTDEGRKQSEEAAGAPGEEMLAGEAGTTGVGDDDRETEPDGIDSPAREEMEAGGRRPRRRSDRTEDPTMPLSSRVRTTRRPKT